MNVKTHFILLAEYNQLMNQRLYAAAGTLSQDNINKDQGAFFKSVIGTLNHILVGDIIWLKRFTVNASSQDLLTYICELEKPKSLDTILFLDFNELKEERENIDKIIINWIKKLTDTDINECIPYTDMADSFFRKPFASLIHHLFLHQVHHRGQVTTLLSQNGVDFGATDLIEVIKECDL